MGVKATVMTTDQGGAPGADDRIGFRGMATIREELLDFYGMQGEFTRRKYELAEEFFPLAIQVANLWQELVGEQFGEEMTMWAEDKTHVREFWLTQNQVDPEPMVCWTIQDWEEPDAIGTFWFPLSGLFDHEAAFEYTRQTAGKTKAEFVSE